MTEPVTMTLDEIEDLAFRALVAAGTSEENARPLADATAETEADGIASHGLAYIPVYCEHVQCGKVDGSAKPTLSTPAPSVVIADAATGFPHPAISLGFEKLVPTTRQQGVAALGVRNSYNCGVLGYHTRNLAKQGLLAFGFTNAPASIAPVGGNKRMFGTNPISLAVPDSSGGAEVLIDQSASVIARSEIMKCAREGKQIPDTWAYGPDGLSTTDPEIALTGSMAPAGGYKGVGIAMMVEIMAAAMTGATLGIDASPFTGTVGGPPKTGQFFLAVDPGATSGGLFTDQITRLTTAMRDQPGVRVPGDGRRAAQERAARDGVAVDPSILEKINAFL